MIAYLTLRLAAWENFGQSPDCRKARRCIPFKPLRWLRIWYKPKRYARPGSLTVELLLAHNEMFGDGCFRRAIDQQSPFTVDSFFEAIRRPVPIGMAA